MTLTSLIRPLFERRINACRTWRDDPKTTQLQQLNYLTAAAVTTSFGRAHGLRKGMSLTDFRNAVPTAPYEAFRADVMRMIAGETSVLWPGKCRRFAQSSGTSDGKSKYIPITADSLRRCHYRGGFDSVANYLHLHPTSRLFDGKSFILGGSFANELTAPIAPGIKVGDLSATLIDCINPLANLVRIPDKATALLSDWNVKLPTIAKAALRSDITNISGVPSWFHAVIRKVMELSGASELHQVWPHLEVFFHGGISMTPYRDLYNSIIDPNRMAYLETYNASEGFFAVQDTLSHPGMLLILDNATFYEFAPIGNPSATPLTAWEVEPGHIYSLIITSCNGLWRYEIGDTVRIESTSPLRISIAGRTKSFINAFGEEVMVHNTDAAIASACNATGAQVLNYTVAPVYTSDKSRGRHQWLIEFHTPPTDIDAFADTLDTALRNENSDYQAKRTGGIFLDRLTVTIARQGIFDQWLAATGKLGGQRKVPRLANDRHIIDPMLRLNEHGQQHL